LRRHYRLIVDLFLLGLIITGIALAFEVRNGQVAWGHAVLVWGVLGLLPLVTIAAILRSRAPWADTLPRVLLWSVLGLGFLSDVVVPLLMPGFRRNVTPLFLAALYALPFSYLFWLEQKAKKLCGPDGSATSPTPRTG
jgi:hypothetical protein